MNKLSKPQERNCVPAATYKREPKQKECYSGHPMVRSHLFSFRLRMVVVIPGI